MDEIDDELEVPETKTKKKRTKSKEKDVAISCKSCGQVINPKEHPPSSTWTLTSPLPDKEGRITLTVMGSFDCPRCHKNVKAAMKKIKSDDELSGKSKKDVLLETLQSASSDISLDELANQIGLTASAVSKATELLIKRQEINGKIENGFYKIK
jgi:predicted RNA-binding Zn-ribbon protein involved in translation (DUF1610 family)